MWFKNRSLAFKLSFAILSCVILTTAVILTRNAMVVRRIMLQNIEEGTRNLCEAMSYRLDQTFMVAAEQARAMSVMVENLPITESDYRRLLPAMIKDAPQSFYGSIVAFEPYAFEPQRQYFGPYAYRESGKEVKFTVLGSEEYQYFYFDWFHIPKLLLQPVWSEPYFDEGGGNVLMTTYSYPFYRQRHGRKFFSGVVTVDISLSRLQKLVNAMKFSNTGYGFLISRFGRIITHPDMGLVMNQTVFSLAEEEHNPQMREIGEQMIAGKSGFVPFNSRLLGERCWLYFHPLKSNGWSLAMVIPERELLGGLDRLRFNLIVIAAIGMTVLLLLVVVVSYRVTRPLKTLTAATVEIGHGNLNLQLPDFGGGDNEIGQLATAFGKMQSNLVSHIENLRKTTADKEKIESELTIAREIQLSIIPKIFPAFPDRKEFNVFAILESAKAVGGDLYDFFFIDDNRLCFSIGDVSGKGVPASLFMAVTQTLLRATAARELSSGEIVTRINRALARDNEMSMFVTYFLGIIDLTTGTVEFSNAGHNPPFILRTDGTTEKVEKLHGMPMGVVDFNTYDSAEIKLNPGDLLFLYTDGVTEAMNSRHEQFEEKRLTDVLDRDRRLNTRQLVESVLAGVKVHAGGFEQSDDITIVAIRYYGPEGNTAKE